MSTPPDYVNEPIESQWYHGTIPDECRCQYEFQHAHQYEGRDVKGRRCGLLVVGERSLQWADRCVFHWGLYAKPYVPSREHDSWLANAIVAAVKWRKYLGEANLLAARFPAGTALVAAQLQSATMDTAWLQGTDLTDAHLHGASFVIARLQGVNLQDAKLIGADLQGATIERLWASETDRSPAQNSDLRRADLSNAFVAGITLAPDANLEGAEIDGKIRDEKEASSASDYQRCESVYRQLKLNFQESGDYRRAGEFFVRERECVRAQAKQERRWGAWLLESAVYYICGHGERPSWVAAWMAGLIFLLAWVHGFLGIADTNGNLLVVGHGTPTIESTLRALYFSMVTFSGLGDANMRPVGTWGEMLAGIQTLIGVFLMALLLVCIVRKFSR